MTTFGRFVVSRIYCIQYILFCLSILVVFLDQTAMFHYLELFRRRDAGIDFLSNTMYILWNTDSSGQIVETVHIIHDGGKIVELGHSNLVTCRRRLLELKMSPQHTNRFGPL